MRSALVSALGAAVAPVARAAWVGGSDAFGRADERSDIDLCVVADREAGPLMRRDQPSI